MECAVRHFVSGRQQNESPRVFVADCCDGSDEGEGVCANTCEEVGRQDREARLKIADTHAEAAHSSDTEPQETRH